MAASKTKATTKSKPKDNPAKPKSVSRTKVIAPRTRTTTGRPRAGQQVDWEAVERDYRTAKFTDAELSAKHRVSARSIQSRRAKDAANGRAWAKDLRDLIRAETDAAVIAETTGKARENVAETVLVAAELNKQVIIGHRKDIRTVRDYAISLISELQVLPDVKAQVGDALTEIRIIAAEPLAEDEDPNLRRIRLDALMEQQGRIRKVVYEVADIHRRVGSANQLADALKKLQELERKAHNIDAAPEGGAYESVLEKALQGIEAEL